jgi:hypothetical protein
VAALGACSHRQSEEIPARDVSWYQSSVFTGLSE